MSLIQPLFLPRSPGMPSGLQKLTSARLPLQSPRTLTRVCLRELLTGTRTHQRNDGSPSLLSQVLTASWVPQAAQRAPLPCSTVTSFNARATLGRPLSENPSSPERHQRNEAIRPTHLNFRGCKQLLATQGMRCPQGVQRFTPKCLESLSPIPLPKTKKQLHKFLQGNRLLRPMDS